VDNLNPGLEKKLGDFDFGGIIKKERKKSPF
jgi:hypothetical protein